MTAELKQSIEELYKVFSAYPFKSSMEGCPCCVSDTDKEAIHSKQLRDLSEENLSRYAFKAMTTWGDVDDFRHYLPRIFELCATTEFIVDTFVVLGKLSYGNWRNWPIAEQVAVEAFLFKWWENAISFKTYFDSELFIEIYKLTKKLDELIRLWNLSLTNNSFHNLLEFIEIHIHNLLNGFGVFKEMEKADRIILAEWVLNNKNQLEDSFFQLEDQNQELATRTSNALYILDRVAMP